MTDENIYQLTVGDFGRCFHVNKLLLRTFGTAPAFVLTSLIETDQIESVNSPGNDYFSISPEQIQEELNIDARRYRAIIKILLRHKVIQTDWNKFKINYKKLQSALLEKRRSEL